MTLFDKFGRSSQSFVTAPSVRKNALLRRRDQFLFLYLRLRYLLFIPISANFMVIANASFKSKIIEKIVTAQLIHYLDINNLLSTYQSRFLKDHSASFSDI